MTFRTQIGYFVLLTAALAAPCMEWSFDGKEPLRSDDGRTVLTGSATVAKGAGITGDALRFDGKKDFLELALNDENRPRREMTLSFWIRPEAGCTEFPIVRSPRRDVVFNGSSGFYWFEAYTADGRQLYNGCAHPRRLKSGEWHHFALVYDQTGVATYLDGRPTGRADADKATGELRFSGVPWRIGGRLYESGGKASGFFRGLLDDFKVLPVAKHAFPEVEKIKRQQRLNAAGFRSNAELEQARRNAMAARFGKEAALLPFAVAGVSALDRLLPDDLFTGEIGAPVKFTAAANERENRQLLLLPYGGNNLPGVTVEVPGTLTGQDGKAVPFRFKVSRIEYAKLPKPSPFMYPLERIPDKLISGDTFDLPGDALAPLWLEVFVPAGTPGGVYRGALSVTAPGNPPLELPVEVKVWNFELPRRNIVPTLVNVWERDLQTSVPEGDAAGFVDLLDQYCTMLLEHRLNPVVLAHAGLVAPWVRKAVYPDYRVENGRVVANMEVFDRLVAKYRRMGLSKVAIGPHYNFDQTKLGGGDWWTNIRATQPEKVWSFIQTHAEEQGFLDDAVAYPIDEPEDNVEFINRVTGMLKRAAPQLPMLLTSGGANYPNPSIHGVDIWVPILHWTNPAQRKLEQAAGKPVWTYVCTGPNYPNPNLHSDTPPCGIRMLAVGAARFGYDGFLHWAANFNTYKNAPADEPNSFAAGEGTYIHADGSGRPVPTVRLKTLADGMEDWTMLLMLEERNPAAGAAIRKKLEALIPERKYDPARPVALKSPKEGSFHTFLDGEAFFPVYDQPELWLKLREEIGEALNN